MAGELGVAVVRTEVDLQGLDDGLAQAEQKSGSFASNIAGLLANPIVAAAAAAGAAIVGFGVAAFDAGMTVDSAMDTIVVKTGATGDELADLKDSFSTVFAGVPAEADAVAGVIGTLNTRLGLTGQPLEDLSTGLLEASRLMGGDVTTNTELFTRVLGDWGVGVDDADELLNSFFVASQETGAGMDGLMQKVVQFGAPMRLMGFTIEEAAAMFGKWEQEGVNAELVMGSLRIAAGNFADAGVPLRDGLFDTMEAIKGAATESDALAIAMDVFGARAGPDMAAAILEGRFSIDELVATMEGSQDAIATTAAQTDDFGEMWTTTKNKIILALEPVGEQLIGLANDIMPILEDVVVNKIIPAIQQFAAWFRDVLLPAVRDVWAWMSGTLIPFLRDTVAPIIGTVIGAAVSLLAALWTDILRPAIESVWAWMQSVLMPFLQGTVFPWLQEHIPAALETLRHFWEEVLKPGIEAVWSWLSGTLIPFLVNVLGNILEVVIPAAIEILRFAWENILKPAIETVWEFLSETVIPFLRDTLFPWLQEKIPEAIETLREFWEEKLLPAITTIWEFIRDDLIPIFEDIWSFIKDDLAPAIETFVTGALDTLKNAWNGIKEAVQFVIDKIQEFKDWIAGLELPDWLTPGSPTPFEIALLGIADALGKVNDGLRETGRSMSALEMARLGAGIAGTGLSWQETNVPFLFQNPGGPGAGGMTIYGGVQVYANDAKSLMEELAAMQP